MEKMPVVSVLADGGKIWESSFDTYRVRVYVPKDELPSDVINYGFNAPYLLVFGESDMSIEEELEYAKSSGLAGIAASYASSVVFVYPNSQKGWEDADSEIFSKLISQSKIHQYYKDGYITFRDRFTGNVSGYFIRGAIFRTYLYAKGKAADYIAGHCLKNINGDGLWGPADVTPVVVTLEGLSVVPSPERRDIPVISIGNSPEVNEALSEKCDRVEIRESADFVKDFRDVCVRYRRILGRMEDEPVLSELGMVMEPGVERIPTSPDNMGDDSGTSEHDIGYLAYYNKAVFDEGKPVPMLLCFHGGGDSAMYISGISGWYNVAHRHNFLLVCVEHHMNSTATEMIELIARLKKRYNVDPERIYASGFSMGGCKTWDLFQEYPGVFAALAPMDATFEVGTNVFAQPAPCEINRNVAVPVFYAGGEITPLPELPFQAFKCYDRTRYLFEVDRIVKPYDIGFENQDAWENKIWGVNGDAVVTSFDPSHNATLTVQLFNNADGLCYVALGSISGQAHECREHTCDRAWQFLQQFRRLPDGSIAGGCAADDVSFAE